MRVHVNGDERDIDDDATIASLVAALGLAGRRVAVAVNREVVPRGEHESRRLAAGDRVEIVHAVQGG